MKPPELDFFAAVNAWLTREPAVEAAVLYGSSARAVPCTIGAGGGSDIDLHVITTYPRKFYNIDWQRAMPTHRLCLQAKQSATGGVNKINLLFASGQVDLVILSSMQMRFARWAMRIRIHRRTHYISSALNEMATSMRTGYRFLKGAEAWQDVYERVVAEMPGVRVGDPAARDMAEVFLIDLVLALRRLERGELIAVQYMLHAALTGTNFRLFRELRLRQGLPLPSFGLARQVENFASPTELSSLQVSARLERNELFCALWSAFDGLRALMRQLVPDWRVPVAFDDLLKPYTLCRAARFPVPPSLSLDGADAATPSDLGGL